MGKPNKLETVNKYIEIIADELNEHLGSCPGNNKILQYLCKRGRLAPERVRNTVILHEYLRRTQEGQKSVATVWDLCDEYNVGETTVYLIIKRALNAQKESSNILT